MSSGSCQISRSNPVARILPDREERFIIHVGVKSATARPSKADNVIWTSHLLSAFQEQGVYVCVKARVPTHSLHTCCLIYVWRCCCVFVCVDGLCVEARWLSEGLRLWQRLINSGGQWGCQLPHSLPSPQSNEAGPQHATSFQRPRLNAGHFFRFVYPVFEKNKTNLFSCALPLWDSHFSKDNIKYTRVNGQRKSWFPQVRSYSSARRMNKGEGGSNCITSLTLTRDGNNFQTFILTKNVFVIFWTSLNFILGILK